MKRAVDFALAGDWKNAHLITQKEDDGELSAWLHACLHKIEGDNENSNYWYAKSGRRFEDFADPQAELRAIRAALT